MGTAQVLVRAGAGAEALCARLARLGFRAEHVVCADRLHSALEERAAGVRALLLAADLPDAGLATSLAAAAPALREGRVTGVALGTPPGPETADRFREAGFSLVLRRPLSDAVLRFQINRAFLRARCPGTPRCELRAPFDWRVSVRAGDRRKEAFLYSLSLGGAFLETARPSPGGARVAVELPVHGTLHALEATVVHTNVPGNLRSDRGPLGMGVRFDPLEPAVAEALGRTVAARSAGLVM